MNYKIRYGIVIVLILCIVYYIFVYSSTPAPPPPPPNPIPNPTPPTPSPSPSIPPDSAAVVSAAANVTSAFSLFAQWIAQTTFNLSNYDISVYTMPTQGILQYVNNNPAAFISSAWMKGFITIDQYNIPSTSPLNFFPNGFLNSTLSASITALNKAIYS